MEIWDAKGNKVLDSVVTQNAEHVEELMQADYVSLQWVSNVKRVLPAGAYIVPFDDGVRYMLLDPYTPDQNNTDEFTYSPQFQHPKMYLGRVPYSRASKDTEGNDINLLDWDYKGYLTTFLSDLCGFITKTFTDEGITTDKFSYSVLGDIEGNVTISISNNDILSVLNNVCNTLDCEWHIDWEQRRLFVGNVRFDKNEGETLELTSGVNVGMASVSSQSDTYYNVYLPQGSTRNMAAATSDGSYYATNRRLELDPEKYPDGKIYTDGGGNVVTKEQFLEAKLPKLVQTLMLDEIYPKIDLYVYDVRNRERYLLDDNGDKVIDHYEGETPVYKRYAIWYMRLAYPIYNTDGTIRSWKDATLGDTFKLIDGYTLMCSFGANTDSTLTSPLAGREFELNYVETDKEAKELSAKADSDKGDTGVEVKKGDYEIIYTTEGNLIIPTTEEQGLVPKGESSPSKNGNKVTIFNVVMGEDFIKAAQNDLEVAAIREIKKQYSDLNQYTFNSDNVAFKKDMPSLYIGRSVKYNDGVGNTLDTRIMKLTTKLDFPFMVEITVGNKVLKGSTSQLKTDVQMILSGNRQTASNGITESVVRSLIKGFGGANFLSKVNDDTARGIITFLQGTNWGSFTSETGAAMTVDPTTGQTYMEVDRLKVRLKAFFEQLEIQKVGYVGGKIVVSKGQGVDILDVEEIYDSEGNLSAYRCYFLGEQEGRRINNLLRVNDQMICKDENISEGSTDGATNKYYWRLATAVSSDVVKRGNNVCHWVDLSATDCDTNSDIPEIGDTICHLGNREDTDRQGAEILSVVDANSPSFTIYSGINSYSLVNKEYIDMGVSGGKAFCNIYGSTYIGDRNRENGYISWDYDKEENVWKMRVKGTIDITSPLSSGGTIGGAITDAANAYKGEFNNFVNNTYAEDKKDFYNQLDGKVETWYQKDDPKDKWAAADYSKHKGDIWYNDSTNKSYRWTGTAWVELKDQAAIDAKALAESKRRVFTTTALPTPPYDAKDLWVQGENGDIMVCVTPKAAGTTASASDWEKASKYTDDTAAQKAQTTANEAATAAQEINASITAIDGNVDVALKDKIITKTEAAAIKEALKGLDAIMADVNKTKEKLVNNDVYKSIADDVKTDYDTAYTNLKAAYDELSKYINDTLLVANPITDEILSSYTYKYSNFKTKYEDYVSKLTVVRNSMDALLNTRIGDIATMLGGLKTTTDAMNESTQINGGLILSSLLALGYTNNSIFNVMSGVSGLYESGETGGGIAFWAGGHRIDINNCTKNSDGTYSIGGKVVNPADFLVRHDGTGYAAGGKMWWGADGKIHADPQSFLINEEYVGNVMQLFKFEYSGGTEFANIVHAIPQKPFENLSVGANGLTLYNGDKSAKFYIKDGVLFLEGDLAVTGGITMYASNGVTSGLLDQVYAILDSSKFEIKNGVITIKGDIGDGKVKGATLGGVAVTLNANGILEFDAYPTTLPASDVYAWAKAATKPTYSWGEITEKPSSFTPSAHTHDDRYYTESEIDTKLGLKLDTSLKGAADGLATLDSSGKVPSSQLPSYVDDVLEYANKAAFPSTGESGKIYIDKATNLTYRWGGTAYVEISQSLALGETSSTAYAGDKGKKNAEDIAALQTGKADKATTLSGYGITDAYTKTEVNTKLTDGSVTKIGTKDVGSATLPIYLKAGVPTAVGTSLAVDITGNSATATKLKTSRTLWGQSFDGSANVSGNMTGVGTITPTGNDLKVVGNLIVTGGIVMYADDGATIESGFAALLAAHIDGVTIKYNEAQQKIYSVMTGIKVNGATYKPSETDGYITIPDYPTSLDWENIENKPSTFTPSSHTHTFASLTSKPTTLSGYGITDAKIANGVITLGTATITPLTAHQKVTLASGTNNGTLKLTVGSKTTDNIAVKGLGSAAYTNSSAYAAASHTHSQYLVASSLDGYVNALTDNTSANVFVTAIAKSGKTLSYTKSFTKKSLTAASHSGWSSADTDKLIIPDMSFIAYWNGAYNSDGGSNLAYCNKGAFGDMATASKSSYYTKSDTYTKTEVNTKLTDGSVTKVGTANVGATNIPIYLKAGVPTAVTLVDTANNLINNLTTGTSTPEDADYYVAQYVGGGTTTTTFHRRPHSALYAYIKGKAEGTWAISVSGNAATATTLQNARTLWGQSFNGSANISGNMSGVGQITFSALSGTNGRALLYQQMADNDFFRIYVGGTGNNGGYAEIATADDGNEPIYVRQYSGVFSSVVRTLTLLDGNGNTTVPGLLTAANGTVSGTLKVGAIPVTNSSTGVLKIDGNLIVTGGITMYATDGVASGLMEQILVDGTTIGKKADGTLYAINTGNVRSIVMGSTTYTPNSSGAVTLPEKVTWANIEGKPSTFTPSSHTHAISQITNLQATLDGKAAASHTHSYLPLSGGTLTGDLYINTNLYGPVVGNNPRNRYDSELHFFNSNSSTTSTYNFGLYQWNDEFQFTYRTSADDLWKGNSFTIQGSDGQVAFVKTPKVGSTLVSLAGHTHSYLPLSGGTMTGNITYTGVGTSYIGNGANDAANGVGGALNNLVISSWWGISFTTSCGGQTYTNKNAVSIDCRNGYVYANTFAGAFSGNASSATKLQTARTIWGQSFDGSNNVDGTLTMLSTFTFSGIFPSNNYILLKVNNGQTTWEAARIGTYIAANNGGTDGYPAGLAFYTKPADGSNSSSAELRMVIDANGNVGIGVTSPSYKLHTVGDIYSSTYIRAASGFVKTNSSDSYVLLGGGGHKTESSLSVNYAASAGNADTLDGNHASAFATAGHTHSYFPYQDTRSTDYAPYSSSFADKGLSTTHLKFNGTDGLYDGGTYHASIYIYPWGDSSGGCAHNLAFTDNGNMWFRSGQSSWGAWKNILHTGNYNSYTPTLTGAGASGTWGISVTGNAATATKLTSSAGSATLPIYFSDGKPVACTSSSVFSNLSNSGNNISVTVAGQNRTLTVGYADTVDGYHASNIMQAGWIGLYRTGGSASTIKWTRIGRFITTANDNPNNDAMIEFFSNGDQNYTYFGHGRLMLSSYGTSSSNMMLTSVSDGSIHFYATIDANRYIWLGHNAWWTGSSKYRVLFTGSFVEWYSSSLTVQTTNPNDNYITDNGTFKYNEAMSTDSLSHSWVWQNNLRVAYATSAGNADTVDGYHASAFATAGHTHNYMPWNNVSSLNANDVSPGWYNSYASITNSAHTNHSSLLYVNNVGTPYQLQIPDSSVLYIYKRWYSGGWSAWSKISAGYADSAGNADTVDGEHSSAFAHIGAFNNLMAAGNEFTFASSGYSGSIFINWRTAGGLNGNITGYELYNGAGGLLGTIIHSGNYSSYALPLAGGTMTGVLTAKANMYEDAYNGALNMANSDIYGLNSIYTADLSDGQAEGIHFYRTSTTVDTFRISNGVMYFVPNRTLGSTATEYTVIHSGNYNSYAPSKTGTGASGTWGISITGNAATASKWATARTLTLTGSVTGSVSIDGSGNVSLATTTNHTHAYLPLAGGTMTGTIKYGGANCEIIRTGGDDTSWRGGLKYSWSSNTTIALWGKNSSCQFVWHAGTDFSSNDVNGTTTRTYDFQVGRANGILEALIGGNKIWHAGNDGSGSGLDADKLDGVHYLNILEREYTGSKYDSSATTKTGWYRIAECYSYSKNGFLLYLGRNYHSSNNENYIFAITVSYGGNISINQIAGSANTRLITKIRVCWSNTSGNKAYVDFYVGTEAINGYFWYTVGSAKSYGTWGANPSTSGYNTVEFSTRNGMSSNKDFYISGQIGREGKNGNWISGRTNAMIRQTTANAYSAFASVKTYAGSWEIGEYTASGERLLFTYVTDTNFNNGNNNYSGQISFESGGNIIASGGITMYSDLRKKNILSNEVLSVKEIAAAPLFRHTYKSDDNGYIHVGTSAQYWSGIHEDWFTRKDSEGYYQMELQNLGVAMGISLAREIVTFEGAFKKYESKTDKKIRLMKKKINDLEEANKALDARIKELEERRTA